MLQRLPVIAEGRPYPPTGLTTARWREIRPEWISWCDVTTTQRHVSIEAMLGMLDGTGSTDDRPHAVEHEGRLYLEDGHNRMVRDLLEGRRYGYVRVHRLR